MPTLKQREIDRIYTAIRPRLTLSSVGGGSGAGTVPPHTHPASAISFEPAGDVAGDDVQEGMEELAEEKLARSGLQTMLGTLQMNSFDITGIDEATFTGTAVIHNPIRIDFKTGTETLIRYLDAIEFDLAGTHTTHTPGAVHWNDDDSVRTLTLDLIDGVEAPVTSVYFRVANQTGGVILAGVPLVHDAGGPAGLMAVYRADANNSERIVGVSAHAIGIGSNGWACAKGLLFGPDFSFVGTGPVYLDGNNPAGLTLIEPANDSPSKLGCRRKVRVGYVTGTDRMIVDIEWRPFVSDLSDVQASGANCGDVLVRSLRQGGFASDDCPEWLATGLWSEVVLDFGTTDPPSDMKVFTIVGDPRVRLNSIITMVASPKPGANKQEDEHEFDCFSCACVPLVEQPTTDDPPSEFRAYVHSLRGKVVGEYTFNYTVSNPAAWNCVASTQPA
jgi:hypothetical protein